MLNPLITIKIFHQLYKLKRPCFALFNGSITVLFIYMYIMNFYIFYFIIYFIYNHIHKISNKENSAD